MDRTRFKFYKRKKFPAHIQFIVSVKKTFQQITWQRNHELFITIPTDIKKIGGKITMVFHWFKEIQKYFKQLLCTGDIDNIEEAVNVYVKI